ncbi:MAG TPA: hypothetical protein VGH28_02820, partial [Polyangiaceae bacterium]
MRATDIAKRAIRRIIAFTRRWLIRAESELVACCPAFIRTTDVKPKYGPSNTPFLTNNFHYRISPPSQLTLVAIAPPAASAKAYGSP